MLKLPTGEYESGQFAWTRSITATLRELSRTRPVTAAGDYAAMNVWYEGGMYKAKVYRHFAEIASFECRTKVTLKLFLNEWFPRLCI